MREELKICRHAVDTKSVRSVESGLGSEKFSSLEWLHMVSQ